MCVNLAEVVEVDRRRGMEQAGGNITYCSLGCTCEGQNLGKWAIDGPVPVESQPSRRQKFKTCRGSCELPMLADNPEQNRSPTISLRTE